MSLDHFREYIKPYHSEIVEHAYGKGVKIVKHSDGNIWPILADFVEVGFYGIHPIQPQCLDIGEVKNHLSDRHIFWEISTAGISSCLERKHGIYPNRLRF